MYGFLTPHLFKGYFVAIWGGFVISICTRERHDCERKKMKNFYYPFRIRNAAITQEAEVRVCWRLLSKSHDDLVAGHHLPEHLKHQSVVQRQSVRDALDNCTVVFEKDTQSARLLVHDEHVGDVVRITNCL